MEVKPTYQQTPAGLLPDTWECLLIGADVQLLSGHHVLANDCNTAGEGVPYITGPADFPEGVIRHTKYTTKPTTLCRQGDILITVKGSGTGALAMADREYCISRQLMAIRPTCWDAGYVYATLTRGVESFSQAATGLIPGLSRGDILGRHLAIPPLLEQQAIAKALSDVDDLIQSLERLIAKKRGLKQAAMQQLLTGQTRLPGFSGEWQVRTLGSLGKCYRGVSYQPDRDLSPFDTSGTLRLLRANNVQNARMVFEDMQYVSAVRVSEVQRLRPRDVLICMANGSRALVGKAAVFPDAADAAYTFGAFMGCFRPTPGLAESRFVFLLFQTEAYRKHIDLLLAGSSINNLRPSSIEVLAVPIPSMISEQAAIAEVLSDMDAEIAALEARLTKTRDLKQGMMQELLTGRTRLV